MSSGNYTNVINRGLTASANNVRLIIVSPGHQMNNTSSELGGSDSDDAGVHNEHNLIQTNGIFSAPVFPARKRGRPAKPDSEKKSVGRPRLGPKGEIRISLTPKRPRVNKPQSELQHSSSSFEHGSSSYFPVVDRSSLEPAKKQRGRPRIHPPKDNSVKRPRGRPKIIIGEKGWRSECYKLKRILKLKDALIDHMQRRLIALGQNIDDGSPLDVSDLSDDESDHNGLDAGCDDGVEQEEEHEEELTYEEVVEEQEVVDDTTDCLISYVPVPSLPMHPPPPHSHSTSSQVEDTHQTYLNLFTTHSDADDEDELRVEENEEEYDDDV